MSLVTEVNAELIQSSQVDHLRLIAYISPISLIWLISLISLISLSSPGCVEVREGDMRFTCRSNIDCPLKGYRCLPLYSGATLSDYCARASCPDDESFERFSGNFRMVSVCDVDEDQDGVADITKHQRPLSADEIGDVDLSLSEETLTRLHKPGLSIPKLFTSDSRCAVGLFWVGELSRCLPPPVGSVYCDDDGGCQSDEYCDFEQAQCVAQSPIGAGCMEDRTCVSDRCVADRCVDGQLGSSCERADECEGTLSCTGQQSAAPGFSPTIGPLACGDASGLLSPCDPAILPCSEGLQCVLLRFNNYSSDRCGTLYYDGGFYTCESPECEERCARLSGLGELFVCVP